MAGDKLWAHTMHSSQHAIEHYLVEIGDYSICMPTKDTIRAYAGLRHRHAGGDKLTVPEELELRLTPGEPALVRFKKVTSKEDVAKRVKKGEKDTFTWEEYLKEVGAQTLKSKFPESKILSLLK